MISIANKPKIAPDVLWRRDGDANQIIIVSREDLPLPLILNATAGRIFSLCDGEHTIEEIAEILRSELRLPEGSQILEDVKRQTEYFLQKRIVEV